MSKRIAVDLGGTHLRVGIVENGKVKDFIQNDTPKTQKELLDVMVDSISKVMSDDVEGIGVSSPGPLSNGVIRNTPNLPFKVFNMKKFLSDKFKIRVEVEHDSDCVALSELKHGVKKKNFLVLTLGTGIGGGIIINGELYHGTGYAGEMGHVVLDEGKYLETLWQESREKSKGLYQDKFLIRDLYRNPDRKAKEIIEELYYYLGQGIASFINTFSPDVFVLMGGPREAGQRFIKGVTKVAKKYVTIPKMPKIVWSKIEHPGILGASLLLD